jgi:hypothetical protein
VSGIARVFPRRTKATPNDALAFVGGPGLFPPAVDEVHISVTFTWDLREAERLAREWRPIAPVKIGGPATGMRGEDFRPGMYLRPGYVITSRGCPNRCWYCAAWKRDGQIRELPIQHGWNVLDDNLLACSRDHIARVLAMLGNERHQAEFTGGLEATRFEPWIAERLRSIKPKQLFFAYDTPDDWEPLKRAAEACWDAGFTKASHSIRAYVLVGWSKDTMEAAERRLRNVLALGIVPMAMLWRNDDGKRDAEWIHFAKLWARPASVCAMRATEAESGFQPALFEMEAQRR